jgi:magnesium chelatase subunit D
MVRVAALCAAAGVDGLRADLVISRAAAALAGWDRRDEVTDDDVRRVAPLALAHRQRRHPLDDRDDRGLDDALAAFDEAGARGGERVAEPDPPQPVVALRAARAVAEATGRRSQAESTRGRLVGDRVPSGPIGSVAVAATARAVATRRAVEADGPPVCRDDLREARREERAGNLLVLAVDASGSMGASRRMEAVKGAVLGILVDAYQRRDRVALVTFRGERGEVVLRPTGSVEVARARLAEVPTGGQTPLAAGIDAALELATSPATHGSGHRPLLVVITDGRATASGDGDPIAQARQAAANVRRRGVDAVVVDAEDGRSRVGLAAELADLMGARYLQLTELTASALELALRDAVS